MHIHLVTRGIYDKFSDKLKYTAINFSEVSKRNFVYPCELTLRVILIYLFFCVSKYLYSKPH